MRGWDYIIYLLNKKKNGMTVKEICDATSYSLNKVHHNVRNLKVWKLVDIKFELINKFPRNKTLRIFLHKTKKGRLPKKSIFLIRRVEDELRDADRIY